VLTVAEYGFEKRHGFKPRSLRWSWGLFFLSYGRNFSALEA